MIKFHRLYWWSFWFREDSIEELNDMVSNYMREGRFYEAESICMVIAVKVMEGEK